MIQLDKPSAYRLARMVESGLLTSAHTIPWADSVIERLDLPPAWVCELAVTKFNRKIVKILRDYAFSDPPEFLGEYNRRYLACLLLRYRRREISWATFLQEAGGYADPEPCGIECEYFYDMLNKLESAEYSAALESVQFVEVESELANSLSEVEKEYEPFVAMLRSSRNKSA